ncbi:unnamed protein product [Chilo suppressalis]|uniref:MD-2-related lipid-recognition domain-containing protein n=1 Tax=Chilo suppressalis TaxID=168631 RepID=A0ABN8L8T0_CHISP|nr:unnamed protein product [Chilo suppressalis]
MNKLSRQRPELPPPQEIPCVNLRALKTMLITASCSCGSRHGGVSQPSMYTFNGRAPENTVYQTVNMLRVVVLLAAILTVRAQTTAVNRCTVFSGALPLNVYIEGCETPPCRLPQLQDAVIDIVFRAPRPMQSMTTLATAFLGILPVPYPLGDNAVTCNFIQSSCPVREGEILTYQLKMFIESFMPVGTSASVEFRIVDQNNSAVMCIRVPIQVVAPVSSRSNSTATLQGKI